MPSYLIIGGGVAGVTAAHHLRQSDPAAGICLLSEEPYPYYYRPRLMEFLAGGVDPAALYYRPVEWYAAQKILLRLHTQVVAIDPANHQALLPAGERLSYDRLLVATGARPFIPPVPGVEKAGVFTLRTMEDAIAIRKYAAGRRRAVVLGGGLLGLETARALSSAGLDMTVVEVAPYLLPKQMDREGAQVLQARLEGLGLRILTGTQAAEIAGGDSVEEIRLKDGAVLACDLALFSTGIVPRIELAKAAGLTTDRGVLVDEFLQTSAEDVFAAGDAAEFNFCVFGLIPPAVEQARAAADNMAGGRKTAYRGTLPAATLKLAGTDLTSLGEATAEGGAYVVLRRAEPNAGVYQRLTLRDGAIVGAVFLGETKNITAVKQLIASRKSVTHWQDRLLDPAFDWKALGKDAPSGSSEN